MDDMKQRIFWTLNVQSLANPGVPQGRELIPEDRCIHLGHIRLYVFHKIIILTQL
jgi:hypothetical protein